MNSERKAQSIEDFVKHFAPTMKWAEGSTAPVEALPSPLMRRCLMTTKSPMPNRSRQNERRTQYL